MSVNERIEEIVKGNDVVLFMKGTPLFPQCGFFQQGNRYPRPSWRRL